MDNVNNCDGYINIPSSQTYRSNSLLVNHRGHVVSITILFIKSFSKMSVQCQKYSTVTFFSYIDFNFALRATAFE
jgi:hypothetical protein